MEGSSKFSGHLNYAISYKLLFKPQFLFGPNIYAQTRAKCGLWAHDLNPNQLLCQIAVSDLESWSLSGKGCKCERLSIHLCALCGVGAPLPTSITLNEGRHPPQVWSLTALLYCRVHRKLQEPRRASCVQKRDGCNALYCIVSILPCRKTCSLKLKFR